VVYLAAPLRIRNDKSRMYGPPGRRVTPRKVLFSADATRGIPTSSRREVYSVRRTSRILASLILLTFVITLYLYLAVAAPQRKLDRFIALMATVTVGKTRLDGFRAQIQAARFSDIAPSCGNKECGYGLRVENSSLSKLRLAPLTVLECSVSFTDGLASEKRVMLSVLARGKNPDLYQERGVVIVESSRVPPTCHADYSLLVRHNYRAYQGDTASLSMDPCVSPENRAKAFAINTACLTRIGGCKTLMSILPRVLNRP
jgi:hypothetical protein